MKKKSVAYATDDLVGESFIPVTGDSDVEEELTQDVDGVSTEETPVVAEADEKSAPQQPDYSKQFEEMRLKYEQDIGKVKSALQKQVSEEQKQKTVLEKKLDELLQSSMDDDDRKNYQYEKLVEERDKLKHDLEETKLAYEQAQQFTTWMQYFNDLGIPQSKLIVDQGLPELFGSGMEAVKEMVKTVKEGAAGKLPQKQGKTPPETVQPSSNKAATFVNLDDAIKHFANGDAEAFWRMAEMGNQKVLAVINELSK